MQMLLKKKGRKPFSRTSNMENIMEDSWSINAFNTTFFDPHMTLTTLKWLKQKSEYNPKSILQAMKEVYKNTLLIIDYQNVIEESATPEMLSQASRMKAEFISIESHLGGFLSCMISVRRERQESESVAVSDRKTIQEWSALMRNKQKKASESDVAKDGSLCSEKEEFVDFPENVLELLLRYSYLFYASGEYSLSKRWLLFYLDHVFEFTIEGRDRTDLRLKCLWGLIASSIMCLPPVETVSVAMDSAPYNAGDVQQINPTALQDENTDGAYTIPRSILIIVDYLESSRKNYKVVTLERIWLIVWSIWGLNRYYFPRLLNSKNVGGSFGVRGPIPGHMEWTRLTDWLFSEQILCIIGTFAPHLLRYIAVIAILNKQRQDHFKATVDIISKTFLKTPDHFVSIIDSLFLKFDIEQAQEKLAYCEKAAKADFLLVPLEKLIEEHARLLIFQMYCRIQKSINIDMMAKKLNMTADTAERWIVNLIRTARLEAKIDSERNRVEITSPVTNAYQEVLDKARNLVARSNVLLHNIEKISISPNAPATNRNNYSNFGRPLLRISNNSNDQRNVVKDIEFSGLFVRKNLVT